MDERLALVLYGCKLAKDLELNLPNLANQPGILLKSCEEIITVFSNVRERLVSQNDQTMSTNVQELQQLNYISAGVQEWLRTSGATSTHGTHQAMELMNAPLISAGDRGTYHNPMLQQSGLDFVVCGLSRAGKEHGASGEVQVDAPDSSRASSSSQRRKRKDIDGDKRVTRVAAPQMGNLDLPPDDGFTWRKYGQKEILKSRFPRSYYRCTHQKFYECPARKQVQRLDDDPFTFEVTYRGEHTCHMSSTAPSGGAPPPQEQGPVPTTAATMQPSSLPTTTDWLSSMQIFPTFSDHLQLPVADMADAMFNSGSNSSNSMDLIFSSMDEKWDSEEKKD